MKTLLAHPKKSPSSKARRKLSVGPRCRAAQTGGASVPASLSLRSATIPKPARQEPRPTSLRQEFRAWRASLPTALERDTLLMPDVIAESVVQEVERFLKSDLPDNFAKRLAAKAHYLYPRHKYFHKGMNRPGNRGRENLLMFMRHWTAGWLKRERYALYKKLPWSFSMGRRLPAPGVSKIIPVRKNW
jgi:hypothetical protein